MATNVEALDSTINSDYANMSIDEEEERGLVVTGDEGEDRGQGKIDLRFCLVGRFLTDKVINFAAMKNLAKECASKIYHQHYFSSNFSMKLILIGCWNRGHGLLINIFCLLSVWRKMSNHKIFLYFLLHYGYRFIIYELDLCRRKF